MINIGETRKIYFFLNKHVIDLCATLVDDIKAQSKPLFYFKAPV